MPISPSHADILRSAFARANKRAWCYFPPFLCAFSLPPNRVVRVCERGGSVCLLVQRPDGMDLLCPPAPFSGPVLMDVLRELRAVNGARATRILWVDEEDAAQMAVSGFVFQEKDAEYLYDPGRIWAAQGPEFRDLRKQVRRFEGDFDTRFRAMTVGDVPGCEALLKHWRKRQGRKHPFLLDWGYTRAALDGFSAWTVPDLCGWCVELDGRIAAFALAGRMGENMAQFFVAKTDPDVPGLSMFLRYRVYGDLSHYPLVNDAGDLGLPGLRQFKEKFRPVARLRVYAADVSAEVS